MPRRCARKALAIVGGNVLAIVGGNGQVKLQHAKIKQSSSLSLGLEEMAPKYSAAKGI